MKTTVEHPEGTKLVPFEGGGKVETILEKNKWYKCKEYDNLVYYCSDEQENYGFTYVSKEWHNGLGFPLLDYTWLPVSEEEVKQSLIAEAEKRGFKEGVKFISAYKGHYGRIATLRKIDFHIDLTPEVKTALFSGNNYILFQGKWAEILSNHNEKILERIATIEKELEQLKSELK
jgi:hypothetical protein